MVRLLVVEDQKQLLRSIQRGLEDEGYTVLAAANGDEGYRYATTEAVDAVILDLMLPCRDGWNVLATLRQDGFRKPILIVTARDSIEDRVAGLDGGADDYLVKPFAFTELVARLRALLRRGSSTEETRLRAGDLEIDRLKRSAVRGGLPLELTNRQFELLEYFVRRVDEVVTRKMIVRDVWKDTTGILTNVVEVCINHLRKKIERPEWPQMLHTVRGVGYILRSDSCAD
ncbi:MAG: response regulator transcription factor [Planctomycetaceae bacterium]|nr:response regulator transcription factor [Planctomycetaceae bacterium]